MSQCDDCMIVCMLYAKRTIRVHPPLNAEHICRRLNWRTLTAVELESVEWVDW